MSWVPSAVSATPALANRSSRPMVMITDAGIPPTRGLIGGFEEPGAGLLQRVVQALHVWPLVGNLDDGAVLDLRSRYCGVSSTGPRSR